MTICLPEKQILAWKVQGFPVLYDNRVKDFWKWDIVQIVWEKTVENLDSVENSKFIRENTEAAVRGWSGINLQENMRAKLYYSNDAL